MAELSDTPTVHEAFAAVMRDVGAIPKGQQVDSRMGGYSFRGIDDLYDNLHGPLAEHGVVIVPHEITKSTESTYTTSGGTEMRLVSVEVDYRIYGPGGDHIPAAGKGEAADAGDKAANKAMTAAYKYLLFQALCIPVEGQPDADASHEPLSRQRETSSNQPDRSSSSGGGPPACGDCGEPITGLCVKRDGDWIHKECPDG